MDVYLTGEARRHRNLDALFPHSLKMKLYGFPNQSFDFFAPSIAFLLLIGLVWVILGR